MSASESTRVLRDLVDADIHARYERCATCFEPFDATPDEPTRWFGGARYHVTCWTGERYPDDER